MIHLDGISKIYRGRNGIVKALDDINLQVRSGEFLVVRGASGSGKTTLILTIGGMLKTTKGRVIVNGKDIYRVSERDRARFRAETIGFVFQMFHLVPYLTVVENILLPAGVGINRKPGRDEVATLLNRLYLKNRQDHKPAELSTGEIQRTAIARAFLNHPKIILADEPTGNLDPDNAAEVMGYLAEYHRGGGTVIVVTHGKIADQYADRIIYLQDGRIVAGL